MPSTEDLLEKIRTKPHPWFGTYELRSFDRSAGSIIVTLTDEDKELLWPGDQFYKDRIVKMNRAELAQAKAGNFMLPGEEQLRMDLLK